MTTAISGAVSPAEVLTALVRHRRVWIASTVAFAACSLVYAMFMTRYWEATQGLVVRQEAVGAEHGRAGKFNDLYEMRTLQETILELAKSRQVLEATLQVVGRAAGEEPTSVGDEQVERLRRRIKMLPPYGAEFGKTEVFYLTVKDADQQRAILLVGELCNQLELRLRQLRQDRADSLATELMQQVALAEQSHAKRTAKLEEFEASVGPDLGELRMLHSAFSGQSDLRQQLVSLEREARAYETSIHDADQLITQLQEALAAPEKLIATPNSLLTSQPALQRLKNGLIDAQLATARLRGSRSDEHPLVLAAIQRENGVRGDLHSELGAAIEGARAERRLDCQRHADILERLHDVQRRLTGLAERRAVYSNRVAAVDHSRQTLDQAREKHSEAVASLAAAKTASLVTRIDQPGTGPYPTGPGRSLVVLVGTFGGFVFGLGLVFLTSKPQDRGELSTAETTRGESARREAWTPPTAEGERGDLYWQGSRSTAERDEMEHIGEAAVEKIDAAAHSTQAIDAGGWMAERAGASCH